VTQNPDRRLWLNPHHFYIQTYKEHFKITGYPIPLAYSLAYSKFLRTPEFLQVGTSFSKASNFEFFFEPCKSIVSGEGPTQPILFLIKRKAAFDFSLINPYTGWKQGLNI
jgi:hypothetical protein